MESNDYGIEERARRKGTMKIGSGSERSTNNSATKQSTRSETESDMSFPMSTDTRRIASKSARWCGVMHSGGLTEPSSTYTQRNSAPTQRSTTRMPSRAGGYASPGRSWTVPTY